MATQAPRPINMAPGFIISAVPLPWKNYLGQFLTSQEQCQSSGSEWGISFFLFYYGISQTLAKTKNNVMGLPWWRSS